MLLDDRPRRRHREPLGFLARRPPGGVAASVTCRLLHVPSLRLARRTPRQETGSAGRSHAQLAAVARAFRPAERSAPLKGRRSHGRRFLRRRTRRRLDGAAPRPPAAVPRGPQVPHSTAARRALSRALRCCCIDHSPPGRALLAPGQTNPSPGNRPSRATDLCSESLIQDTSSRGSGRPRMGGVGPIPDGSERRGRRLPPPRRV